MLRGDLTVLAIAFVEKSDPTTFERGCLKSAMGQGEQLTYRRAATHIESASKDNGVSSQRRKLYYADGIRDASLRKASRSLKHLPLRSSRRPVNEVWRTASRAVARVFRRASRALGGVGYNVQRGRMMHVRQRHRRRWSCFHALAGKWIEFKEQRREQPHVFWRAPLPLSGVDHTT